jgi:hypothetical protein
LLEQTDAPGKSTLPLVEEPVVNVPLKSPLVTRNYEPKPATDAENFRAMFMAIDAQRQEVGARMEDYRYNNDMARAIEKLKNAIRVQLDKIKAEEPDRKIQLDHDLAWYIYSNNLPINGVNPRDKYPTFTEFADQRYGADQLSGIIGTLDIDKSNYTDANSQYMQQMQLALGLLQVYQQLLTGLIDATKRIKEGITSKVS